MRPTIIGAGMLAVLALVFGIGAFQLGFWVDDNPGPGVLPLIASGLLLPLAILSLRENVSEEAAGFEAGTFAAIGALIAYSCAVPSAGFVLPTVVLIFAWCHYFNGQPWLRSFVCSGALTLVGVVIFNLLLQVPFQLWPVLS